MRGFFISAVAGYNCVAPLYQCCFRLDQKGACLCKSGRRQEKWETTQNRARCADAMPLCFIVLPHVEYRAFPLPRGPKGKRRNRVLGERKLLATVSAGHVRSMLAARVRLLPASYILLTASPPACCNAPSRLAPTCGGKRCVCRMGERRDVSPLPNVFLFAG